MGKFDGIIICSDYDGTITRNDLHVVAAMKRNIDNVCKESADAIRYFTANGGRFIIASGRSPRTMMYLSEFLPIDDLFAGVNGTVLYSKSKDEVIYKKPMRMDVVDFIKPVFDALPDIPEFHFVGQDVIPRVWVKGDGDPIEFAEKNRDGLPLKIIFDSRDNAALMEKLQRLLKELYSDTCEIALSCSHFIECNDIESGKGEIIRYLKRTEPDKKIVALGDYYNDRSMFLEAEYKYCPENAVNEIKRLSNKVLCQSKDGFIAEAVAEIEKTLC